MANWLLLTLLSWEESHGKGLNASTAFTVELWDEVEVKLWDPVAKGDKIAGLSRLRPAILETL